MLNKLPALFCIIVLLCVALAGYGQDNCDASSLDVAEQRYDIGRLTECIEGLKTCLQQKGFTTSQQVRAYKLIAMCYLAMDMKPQADSAIQNILYRKFDFTAADNDPDRFKNELLFILANQTTTTVSSVSKRTEDEKLAPATTYVITQQQILQRGYTDLIDVLKDIPGFDISVYYGQTYANIYQRGFRTNNTDKTLLLIDGIEDNDVWSNFADISQQYPITNIKQVEVVYGPSSTMYGPNAFSGVINVITKDAKDYLHNNRNYGLMVRTGAATFNTKYIDISGGYKKGIVSLSATGRIYYSDRPDLSSDAPFDYNPSIYSVNSTSAPRPGTYKRLMSNSNGTAYLDSLGINYPAPNANRGNYIPSNKTFVLHYDSATGKYTDVSLTNQGIALARSLDSLGYLNKKYTRFSNTAQAYYINTKLSIGNYSFGMATWSKTEGIGTTFTDRFFSVNGSKWKPEHFYVYSVFSQPLNDNFNLSVSANYRVHRIADNSKITTLKTYENGLLNLKDLQDDVISSPYTNYYYEQSQQFRSEIKLIYNKGNFGFVSGAEVRNGIFQKYYFTDTIPKPDVNGSAGPGGEMNYYHVKDIGAYFQGTARTNDGWGFTAGARVDNNTIEEIKGLGTTITPRLVVDYSLKRWVFKAIYSSGIQNVSNFTRFDDIIVHRDTSAQNNLKPEKIHNYEISATAELSKKFTADADVFFSDIDDVVGTIVIGSFKQNENIGKFRIWGTQTNLTYKTKNLQVTLNHTFTHPRQIIGLVTKQSGDTVITYISDTTKRVADIASNKINAIVNYTFFKNYNLNVRINYVGLKRAGDSTSVPNNGITEFPGYLLSNFSFTIMQPFGWQGGSIQATCNNLFNKKYYSPGIRAAGGSNYPSEIRQMGRTFSVILTYEL